MPRITGCAVSAVRRTSVEKAPSTKIGAAVRGVACPRISFSMKKLVVLLISIAVLGSPALAVPAHAAPLAPSVRSAAGPNEAAPGASRGRATADSATTVARPKKGKKSRFRVRGGVVFNNPFRRDQAWRVLDKVSRAIKHVRKRQTDHDHVLELRGRRDHRRN